jgi:O-antigen/teichoic acid export membrane protein
MASIFNIENVKLFFLKNNNSKQTIFKNTFWLGLAEVIQKVSFFIIGIWMARNFGPEIYGKWVFALSFVGFFSILADFGFGTLMTREISRNRADTAIYIDNIMIMKIALGALALVVMNGLIVFFKTDPIVIKLVFLLGVYIIMNSFAVFFQSIFRANEKMQYEAFCRSLQSLLLVIIVIFVLIKGGNIVDVGFTYLVVVTVGSIFSAVIVWHNFSKFFKKINVKVCKNILKKSWPFALSMFLAAIYFKIGMIIVGSIGLNEELGFYAVSFNIIMVIILLPQFLTFSIYPYFSRIFIKNKRKLKNQFIKITKWFISIGIAISIFLWLSSSFLINFIYGKQYKESIVILKILTFVIVFAYIAHIVGISLSSVGLQWERVKGQMFAAFTNICGNIILIPLFGIYGVALALIFSEIVLAFSYYYLFYNRFYKDCSA